MLLPLKVKKALVGPRCSTEINHTFCMIFLEGFHVEIPKYPTKVTYGKLES
jgi:hypothetical protein